MKNKFLAITALMMGCCAISGAQAQSPEVFTVQAGTIKAHIQPTMYGIFFEDINLAADGGVYAELVKNRSFEFGAAMQGWTEQKKDGGNGSYEVIDRSKERPENAHYISLKNTSATGAYGIANEGFRGIGITKGEQYTFAVMARQTGAAPVKLTAELHDEQGNVVGSATLTPTGKNWGRYSVKFPAAATVNKGSLYVWLNGKGGVDLDMISLFPQHTWKNRPGGLRADLVQKLADLHPGFLRFPGGCIVEGRDLSNRYQWKKTIGDIDKRTTIMNRWNVEFKHRPAPDYYQSFGLGFMEYFMTAEDIGAAPLPILNCGMACQYNSGELAPMDKLDPYIQDALDLIEFANGGPETKWGKLRTELGHPKPFNLKLMGVGNEQWGEQYIERWKVFTKAIKDKYPYMQLVTSVGPSPDGDKFDLLNTTFRNLHADILDEHYYCSPKWFRDHANRYDNYDRNGPKIFAGEYAAQSVGGANPNNKNNWDCALSEAAFMTGLERNADVVKMASYAPLFAHIEGWQWTPNLIWFDNLRSYGTPNYYVQQQFSVNKGTDVVPVLADGKVVEGQNGSYATACLDKNSHQLIIKFVNYSADSKKLKFDLDGQTGYQPTASVTTLASNQKSAENSLDDPKNVSPVQSTVKVNGKSVEVEAEPYSLKIIKLNYL